MQRRAKSTDDGGGMRKGLLIGGLVGAAAISTIVYGWGAGDELLAPQPQFQPPAVGGPQ